MRMGVLRHSFKALFLIQKSPGNEELDISEPESLKLGNKMVLPVQNRWQSFKDLLIKVRNCCSTFIAAACLILLIISLLALAFKPSNKFIHVLLVDTERQPDYTTDAKFLSVALDASLIAEGFENFDMTNVKLQNLISALQPGYLRIGGTMADRLLFVVNNVNNRFKTATAAYIDGGECSYEGINCKNRFLPNFTMSGVEWLQLNKLALNAGLTILFDLNCLIRYDNGSWNSENSESLIAFSQQHNLTVQWELGNEPNSFQRVFQYEVNASQLADDFIKLRNILNKYPLYKDSLLVGPDTTRPHPNSQKPVNYLENFLEKAGNYINATTWHQYYFNGRTAVYIDFINPTIFNTLKYQITTIYDAIDAANAGDKPVWLGETASAYGGGAPGYSDRFIATFIWLDKLGVAAQYGINVVIRQSLFKGYYALIYDDITPSPDWWVSVIYKRLVGSKVVHCYSTSSALVRLYCHCTSGVMRIPSLTVFGINMKSTEAKIRIEGLLPITDLPYSQKVLAYILTTNYNLLSKVIMLNGEELILMPNGELPPLPPKVVESQPYLVMPPYSLVFWVVPSPLLHYCQ